MRFAVLRLTARPSPLLCLLQEQHPEEELIRTKQDEVNAAWQRLKGLALQRQGKLFGAAEVQRFNRYRPEWTPVCRVGLGSRQEMQHGLGLMHDPCSLGNCRDCIN